MPNQLDSQVSHCQYMLDSLPFLIYAIDSNTNQVTYGNQIFRKQYPQWQTTPCHLLINGLEEPCTGCKRNQLFNENRHPNGIPVEYEYYNEFDERWYKLQEKGIYWEDGRSVIFKIATDISDIKEMQNHLAEAHAELMLKHKELEHLASTDTLTQIYNRDKLGRVFNKELHHVELGDQSFSIISVDIDRFKQVNDTFGHATGDAVLIAVARNMKYSLRATDYIGRWGGEEFLILCPQTILENAMLLADRIREHVAAQPYATRQQQTVSIGVATYRTGDTLDSLLHRADQALYMAKETGRNRVCTEEQVVA